MKYEGILREVEVRSDFIVVSYGESGIWCIYIRRDELRALPSVGDTIEVETDDTNTVLWASANGKIILDRR